MIIKTFIITLLLSFSLFASNTKKNIDLTNNNTNIKILNESSNIPIVTKNKKDYQKKYNLLEPVIKKEEKLAVKKKDDISIDGDLDFNKSEKTIDGVKFNLGTKF